MNVESASSLIAFAISLIYRQSPLFLLCIVWMIEHPIVCRFDFNIQ